MLPDELANAIVAELMNDAFVDEAYAGKPSSSLQTFEKLFSVIEQVKGTNALKTLLENIDIEDVVKRGYSIVAHYFDTLKRLDVNWKTFFSEEKSNPYRFVNVVSCSTSAETLKMVIDICRGVGDDFLKSILEKQHKSYCWNESDEKYYFRKPMHFAFHRNHLAGEFIQILLDTMKDLYHTTSEMYNRRVFTSEDFTHVYDREISARDSLIKILLNQSGPEQLCDATASSPLQIITQHCGGIVSTRLVIERCRELGGTELIQKQFDWTDKKNTASAFTYSFSPSFQKTVVQYFVEVMKDIGMDFLKQQLFKTDKDGNTLYLAACKQNLETLEYVLNDVFKANNFTDEEILAHFQHLNLNKQNVLIIAAQIKSKDAEASLKLLIAELLRLHQRATGTNNKLTILKDMLGQRCWNSNVPLNYTPLMHAINRKLDFNIIKTLFNLYRHDCAANDTEVKDHLRGALRVSSRAHCSCEAFDYFWEACLNFKDDTFLKYVVESNRDGGTIDSYSMLRLLSSNSQSETSPHKVHTIVPHLVQFDLFDKQYQDLYEDHKTWLARHKIDAATSYRKKLQEEKEKRYETERQLWKMEDKLVACETQLAAALAELSEFKGEKSMNKNVKHDK